jgi:hypothetical protein
VGVGVGVVLVLLFPPPLVVVVAWLEAAISCFPSLGKRPSVGGSHSSLPPLPPSMVGYVCVCVCVLVKKGRR